MFLKNCFPVEVLKEEEGLRCDQVLARRFPEFSRSRWSELLRKKIFKVQEKILSPSRRMQSGERIELNLEFFFDQFPQKKTQEKIYQGPEVEVVGESREWVVVNKPVGLAVHAGAGISYAETLAAWLEATDRRQTEGWDPKALLEGRAGVVHRLDKGTSGLMVLAKSGRCHRALSQQFALRKARRIYEAVVSGDLKNLKKIQEPLLKDYLKKNPSPVALKIFESGQISFASFLERDPVRRTRFRVSPHRQGKQALTSLRLLLSNGRYSRVEFKLETGRTHQIRVHSSFLGYPLLGDELYGGEPADRIFLHAKKLEFVDPDSSKIQCFQKGWGEWEQRYFSSLSLVFSSNEKEFSWQL